jgi:MFS family permease
MNSSKIFNKLIGPNQLSHEQENLLWKFLIFSNSITFVTLFASTIVIIYVLEYVTYLEISFLIGITFVTQSLLDYPSGNIGDYIGQKWVLFFAMTMFCVSFYLLSISITMNNFIIIYILFGIAKSQESGAIQSWFEKNYSQFSKEADPENQIYKKFLGIHQLGIQIIGGVSIVLGGFLSLIASRTVVFQMQMFIYFLLAIASVLFLNDLQNKDFTPLRNNLIVIFKMGLEFVFLNRQMLFYVLGSIIFNVSWIIWGELVLIPMYYGYTGSDFLAGLFRTLAYFLGLFLVRQGSKLSIRLKNKNFIFFFKLTHGLMVFSPYLIVFWIFPLKNEFTLFPIITYLIIAFFFPLLDLPAELLEKVFYLETIPNSLRNSYYSLLSTLIAIMSFPGLLLGGFIIDTLGYVSVVMLIIFLLVISTLLILIGLHQKPKKVIT